MSKYSIGALVTFKGRECEVVGEYYPYRGAWNPSSKAKHLLLKPYKLHMQAYNRTIQKDQMISMDQSAFGDLGHAWRSLSGMISAPVRAAYVQPLGTQYDPKQQPWDEGDI